MNDIRIYIYIYIIINWEIPHVTRKGGSKYGVHQGNRCIFYSPWENFRLTWPAHEVHPAMKHWALNLERKSGQEEAT